MRRTYTALFIACLATAGVTAGAAQPERAFRCTGRGAGDAETRALTQAAEAHPFYVFSRTLLGAPVACRVSWETFDGGRFGTLRYTYADGSRLRIERQPPETSLARLELTRGFADPVRARAFLETYAREAGFHIDWSAKPETGQGAKAGTRRETYWDPDEGLNAGADLLFLGKTLVGIGFHAAL